jgi:hypothetical protein
MNSSLFAVRLKVLVEARPTYIDASINDVSIELIQINAPGTELPGFVVT